MPFWWARRRKFWRRNWRPNYRRKRYNRRFKKRRRFNRRGNRRTYRRRRHSRRKVRRKKRKLTIQQWQPDCIRKCKISGFTVNCLGAHGRQFACFSDNRFNWTPPTTPGGGGFGVEKYTLEYLYDEFVRGNNRWSSSNVYLDLVRYNGCKFIFYRHPWLDFVVSYKRMYPMNLDKYTYTEAHPYNILKSKHKVIIHSLKRKPRGRIYVKVKIKPPKQSTNKWFFQETMAETGLVQLNTAVCDLNYSYIGCCASNQLITFPGLNLQFYKNAGWGNATHEATYGWYRPYANAKMGTYKGIDYNGKPVTTVVQTMSSSGDYLKSINMVGGWFTPALVSIVKLTEPSEVPPMKLYRYNPTRDTGHGNAIWLVNVVRTSYDMPETDKTLIAENLPLWELCWGFFDYVQKVKKDPTFLATYYCVIQSPFIEPHAGTDKYHIPIDYNFLKGKGPFGEIPTEYMSSHWFPRLEHQQEILNSIVQCGPFVPKLENQKLSTWELHSHYTFYFKWGGSQLPDPETADPKNQGTYDVPSAVRQAIQILDPQRQRAEHILHAWDLRRGFITKKACKRMYQDSETSSTISTDTEKETSKKKKKLQGNSLQILQQKEEDLQTCLLSLCEEHTSKEAPPQNLQQLIQQQQQQQKQLKLNILHLLSDIRRKQQVLQLQTGLLE
nr:MAG: ORF1 [Torque teno midi virus]